MIDHVNKDGLTYRMAYPFSYKPTEVRGCSLPYRVVVFGFLWVLQSLIIWAAFTSILGLIGGSAALLVLLSGHTLIYDGGSGIFKNTILGKFLDRLIIFNYKTTPMKKVPTVGNRRILPWHIVAVIGIPWALWYIVPSMVTVAGSAAHGIWGGITWLAAEFMSLSLWIPFTLFGGLLILGLIIFGIRQFRKSETWALIKLSIKARADKICPILPVK